MRHLKTKPNTIQPPPLTGIYKVPGSGSLFTWKPEKNIRQAIDLPKSLKMLLSRLATCGVSEKRFACNAQLSADKTKHFVWDGLSKRQQSPRIPQGAQLKCKANPVLWPSPFADMIKVIIGQRVVTKHIRFVGWQIKKVGALALGQNGAVRHVSFAIPYGLCNFVLAMKYGTCPVPESDDQTIAAQTNVCETC